MAATIDAVCSRVTKERQKKTDKGMSLADLTKELGSEEAHKKKACMKEVKQAQSLWSVTYENMMESGVSRSWCVGQTPARTCECEHGPDASWLVVAVCRSTFEWLSVLWLAR